MTTMGMEEAVDGKLATAIAEEASDNNDDDNKGGCERHNSDEEDFGQRRQRQRWKLRMTTLWAKEASDVSGGRQGTTSSQRRKTRRYLVPPRLPAKERGNASSQQRKTRRRLIFQRVNEAPPRPSAGRRGDVRTRQHLVLALKAPYCPAHTGPVADRYTDWSLPSSTDKIDRRLTEKLTVDNRLKKKKGKEERSTWPPSSPSVPSPLAWRPRVVAAPAARG
ncbi:hypothetical protein GW17_00003191 [Ensete ventricosum]|nr:hypothetical protein GW17_00003191 [Ensete ventricosum]